MRRYSALIVSALAVVFAACASYPEDRVVVTQPAAAVATVTIPTEIATIHPAYVTAWQGTDPAALRVYFGDDAVVVTPSGQYTGWSNIQTGWINTAMPTMKNYTLIPATFTRDGDVIVENGDFSYVMNHDGTAMTMKNGYTYRWKLQPDNTWRIVSVQIK